MNKLFLSMLAAATALVSPAIAQQSDTTAPAATAPAATAGTPATDAMQGLVQNLKDASQQLLQAAQAGGDAAMTQAKQVGSSALDSVRQAMGQMPQQQRDQIEQDVAQAQTALDGNDAKAGADAMNQIASAIGISAGTAGGGAQIMVQQVAPQLTVTQPEAQVTVRQGQPEIIVHQPAPTVTVDIPQPEITVRMPKPEVSVSQAQPQVQVSQAQPVVTVQPAQPTVQVEQQKAQVNVQKLASTDNNVKVEGDQQPKITYSQDQPKIVVNQAQGQPNVKVENAGDTQQAQPAQGQALQQDNQASANGQPQLQNDLTTAQPQQQAAATDTTTAPVAAVSADQKPVIATEPVQTSPLDTMSTDQLIGQTVYGRNGENIGEINDIVIDPQAKIGSVVVGVGGFLGIGERNVAIAFNDIKMAGGNKLMTDFDKSRVEQMKSYDKSRYTLLPRGQNVNQVLGQ